MEEHIDAMPTVLDADTSDKASKRSLALGITSIVLSILPIISFPIAVFGIVYGEKGKLSPFRKKAKVGITLSWVGIILAILSSLIWIPALSTLSGPSESDLILSTQQYNNSVNGFSITPPKGWRVELVEEDPTQPSPQQGQSMRNITFTAPYTERVGLYSYTPIIIVTGNAISREKFGTGSLSESFHLEVLNHIKDDITKNGFDGGHKVENISIITINDVPVIKFSYFYTTSEGDIPLTVISIIAMNIKNGNTYSVTTSVPTSVFPKYSSLYNDVLGSFKMN